MQIRPLEPEDDGLLVDFLDRAGTASPAVLGYHYPFYREMLSAIGVGKPVYLGAWDEEQLIAVLPGFVRQGAAGTVYGSLPFFGPNAGILCSRPDREEAACAALLGSLRDLLGADHNVLSASVYTPFLFSRYELYDRNLPRAIVLDKITQWMALRGDEWPKKLPYDIRHAEKCGVVVSEDYSREQVDRFYEIYEQNCRQAAVAVKPRQAIDHLLDSGSPSRRVRLYLALREGEVIAGLMMLWGPATASYYLPCTLHEARSLQPSSLLIDHAARDARSHGLRYWNWEASPSRDSGVYQFKAKWGSQEAGYRIYVLPFQPPDAFRGLGSAELQRQFPYFFVYPFDRL